MEKLNKLGYSKIEVLAIIVLLGIVAFITINKTSYAFANDDSSAVKEVIKLIEIQAEDYAMDHLEIFEESKTTFITVNDLVENKYLIGNDEGLVTNPANNEENFNSDKIKLEYDEENKKVKATLVN